MSLKIIHAVNDAPGQGGQGTMTPRTFVAALSLLVGVGVAARVLALPRLLPDLDAVNFARSLNGFGWSRGGSCRRKPWWRRCR
jgi:hypothetical protein